MFASRPLTLLLCYMQEHDQPSLVGLPHNAQLQVSYSAGLQALQLGKYSTALRCFQVSVCSSSASISFTDCMPAFSTCQAYAV